ncbi:hypothetical protein K488DRAFT_87335 [Vararia minispora EC-137]|uniref:Uncharacterized protein n=1 Tax=Vararia minispora EC-137 TaxID=1314806 RepID=A0ACB8QGT4_9AGAM|nr:hypothetical protein K488DRAFT_87335 [Vararia minispora EC-137]
MLHNYCQENGISLKWQTTFEGPSHAGTHTAHPVVNGVVKGAGGTGRTLGQAKMAASESAIQVLLAQGANIPV